MWCVWGMCEMKGFFAFISEVKWILNVWKWQHTYDEKDTLFSEKSLANLWYASVFFCVSFHLQKYTEKWSVKPQTWEPGHPQFPEKIPTSQLANLTKCSLTEEIMSFYGWKGMESFSSSQGI